jgi:hypothetical protein
MKKKRRDYSIIRHDDLAEVLEPGKQKVIESREVIDRDCFIKISAEKLKRKIAKVQSKLLNLFREISNFDFKR